MGEASPGSGMADPGRSGCANGSISNRRRSNPPNVALLILAWWDSMLFREFRLFHLSPISMLWQTLFNQCRSPRLSAGDRWPKRRDPRWLTGLRCAAFFRQSSFRWPHSRQFSAASGGRIGHRGSGRPLLASMAGSASPITNTSVWPGLKPSGRTSTCPWDLLQCPMIAP